MVKDSILNERLLGNEQAIQHYTIRKMSQIASSLIIDETIPEQCASQPRNIDQDDISYANQGSKVLEKEQRSISLLLLIT